MKNVRITVAGQVNSGKSTVAAEVANALRASGFDVSLNDEPMYEDWANHQQERVASIRTQMHIVVDVVNLPRQS